MSNKVIVNGVDVIELIERDKPMKPLKLVNTNFIYWCPKCGCSSIQRYANFCYECGQRLMWGNENE